MSDSDILQEQRNLYRDNFLIHQDSPRGTYQNDEETQHVRYDMITAHLLNAQVEHSLEDIGCGICDLYRYLLSKSVKVKYSGTEIVPEMIELAKKKYPEVTIKNRDIVRDKVTDRYDFVVLSGTLNIPGQVAPAEWKEFCFDLINSMFEMCNSAISFNFLTTHSTFTDPTLFYFNPAEVVDHCLRHLSRFVELKHNYALYEGSVTVYKQEYIRKQFDTKAFAKYFRNTK